MTSLTSNSSILLLPSPTQPTCSYTVCSNDKDNVLCCKCLCTPWKSCIAALAHQTQRTLAAAAAGRSAVPVHNQTQWLDAQHSRCHGSRCIYHAYSNTARKWTKHIIVVGIAHVYITHDVYLTISAIKRVTINETHIVSWSRSIVYVLLQQKKSK